VKSDDKNCTRLPGQCANNYPIRITCPKKQHILETISEQLVVLCDQHQVPDLTDKERMALHEVYIKTRTIVHQLTKEYEIKR